MGVRKVEWEHFYDDKWFGYCEFGIFHQRFAVTVALVTGKAVIELLASIETADVLL